MEAAESLIDAIPRDDFTVWCKRQHSAWRYEISRLFTVLTIEPRSHPTLSPTLSPCA